MMKWAGSALWLAVLVGCTPKTESVGMADGEDGEEDGDEGSSGNDGEEVESGPPPGECASEVAASWATFEDAIEATSGTYHYARTDSECNGAFCDEPSCSYETSLEVQGGVVTRRRMEITYVPEGATCEGQPFDEVGADVGTHDDTEPYAAPVRTIDELYASCCDDVFGMQSSIPGTTPYFSVHDDGILRTCFLEFDDCGESCDAGPAGVITIASFATGPLP